MTEKLYTLTEIQTMPGHARLRSDGAGMIYEIVRKLGNIREIFRRTYSSEPRRWFLHTRLTITEGSLNNDV